MAGTKGLSTQVSALDIRGGSRGCIGGMGQPQSEKDQCMVQIDATATPRRDQVGGPVDSLVDS